MSTDNIPKSIHTPMSWDILCQRVLELANEKDALEQKLAVAVRALEQIKCRFDTEDRGGMPSAERGPSMAWAMWTDASSALALINPTPKKAGDS